MRCLVHSFLSARVAALSFSPFCQPHLVAFLLPAIEPVRLGLLAVAVLAFVLELLRVWWRDRVIGVEPEQLLSAIDFFPQVAAAVSVL